MNKSYRVLFNRARGCMMVVNELTSVAQKKGSKLVVALPIAFSTMMVQAADPGNFLFEGGTATVTQDIIAKVINDNVGGQAYTGFRVKGESHLTIDNKHTFVTAHNIGEKVYTAFAIKPNKGLGSTIDFVGAGNATFNAVSRYGAVVYANQPDENQNPAKPTVFTFNNHGDVTFNSIVEGAGLANSNATGFQGNKQVFVVGNKVQNFNVNVHGSGRFNGNAANSNGTAALLIGGDTFTVDAANVNLNVVTGKDQTISIITGPGETSEHSIKFDKEAAKKLGTSYGVTYGMNSKGKVTFGANTQTNIHVEDHFWNAVGISNDPLYLDMDSSGNFSNYNYSDLSLLGDVNVNVLGSSHGEVAGNQFTSTTNIPVVRLTDTYGLYAAVTEMAGVSNYEAQLSKVVLGSTGKTVRFDVKDQTVGAKANVYGIYGSKADITIDGQLAQVTVDSKTDGTAYGLKIENETTVNLNSDSTEFNITGKGKAVGIEVLDTAVLNLNGKVTINATNGLMGNGTVNVANDLTLNNSSIQGFTGQFNLKGGNVVLSNQNGYFVGNVNVNGGSLDLTGFKLADGTLSKTTLTAGTVKALSGQIFVTATEGEGKLASSADKLANHGLTFNGGTLTLNDSRYTLDYSASASNLVGQSTQVVFTGTLVDDSKPSSEKNQIDLTETEVQQTGTQNTVHANATGNLTAEENKHNLAVGELPVTGDTNTTVVAGNLGVKDLALSKEATKVDVNDGKRLTLVGATASENLIKRDPAGEGVAKDLTVTVGSATQAGVLQLGVAGVESGGVINDQVVVEAKGNVTTVAGDFTLKNVDVKGNVNVQSDAKLTIETVKLTDGTITTLGDLTIHQVDQTGADGVIYVGNEKSKGALTVTQSLNGAVVFLDPVWTDGVGVEGASKLIHKGNTVDGTVIAGRNSYAVFGTDTDATFLSALGQSGLSWGQKGVTAALYADKALNVQKGILVDGSLAEKPATNPADGTVTFAANSLFVANVDGLATGTAMLTGTGALSVDATSKALLVNVKKGEKYKLHSADTTNAWDKANVTSANGMFVLNKDLSTGGEYVFDLTKASTIYGDLMQATHLADAAMSSKGEAYDYANQLLTDLSGDKAAVAARFDAAMNPVGALGVYTTGYDRSAELRQSVREQVGTVSDSHLWVDVVGGRAEFDGLSTGAQSLNLKTEHGGVVVGAETVVADTTVGVAATAGKGSTRNSVLAAKDHFDYYGFTVYGQKSINGLTVTADASVTALNSEVTVGGVVDENVDTDTVVWSLGAEVAKTYQYGEMNITPFVGADVYHLRADGYRTKHGVDVASVNATAVEFPVGVRSDMTFDTNDGTKVKPGFALAVVPTVGDRDIDPTVTFAGTSQSMNYTFTDDVKVRSAITLDAVKDRFGLGIGLGYDWGNEERSGLNAQVKARFLF